MVVTGGVVMTFRPIFEHSWRFHDVNALENVPVSSCFVQRISILGLLHGGRDRVTVTVLVSTISDRRLVSPYSHPVFHTIL